MYWKSDLFRVGIKIRILLVSILTLSLFYLAPVWGHVPHDVVFDVAISPNYERDRTVFHLIDSGNKIWGNVFESHDGGLSWQRIEQGLDNKHSFSSLAAASGDTLYLTTRGDGVYKTQDGGHSWFKANGGLATLNLDLVRVAPHTSDLVLAAGSETGLYQTSNGAASWHRVLAGSKITAIAFADGEPDAIAVGDSRGNLYFSGDRGETWQPLQTIDNAGKISAIAFSPEFASDRTLFVGTERGVFKTTDGGTSFVAIRGLADPKIVSIEISPDFQTDATLFAATWHQGVFVSNDGGSTWKKSSQGLTTTPQADKYHQPNFQQLRISPAFERDGTMFVGGFDGLFKTTSSGNGWQDVNVAQSGTGKIKKLAVSPNYGQDKTLAIAAYYGGAYLSQDGGSNWRSIDRGLKIPSLLKENLRTNVLTLGFSPNYAKDETLFACATGSFFISSDGGKHWQKSKFSRALRADQYMVVSPDFASDRTIYLFNIRGAVLRSTNGGKSFSKIGDLGNHAAYIPSLAISPNFATDGTIYVGGFPGGIRKTSDGGRTWQLASNGIATQEDYFTLAISPNYQQDGTVLAGTTAGLYQTSDGGKNWAKLTGTAYSSDGYIDELAISPDYQQDSTAIARVRGEGLFKTSGGGTTFTRLDDYVTGPVAFSPAYAVDRTIYSSTDAELYKSNDGGDTWNATVIPLVKNNSTINYLTYLYLQIAESPITRFVAALAIALLSYLVLRYCRLTKRWRGRKWQINSVSTFAVFIGVFIFLSI